MGTGQSGENRVMKMVENIKEAFDNAERIGVIGSPSSTGGLTIDILGTAVNKRLVGNLSIFNYIQEGDEHYALGQITEITMKNVWSEDPTMRGLIRQKGRVDPITERQDVHTANMMVSSVFCRSSSALEPSILGTVPSTGTSIKLLDENIMNALLADYLQEIFYLGRAYGTNIKMPMWFKHFGSGPMGAGEAYHIGVFGKTGSGKSVLAKMMMLGYARHKNMAIFILDPQGEFSRDLKNQTQIKGILEEKLERNIEVYDLHNLVLTGWELFKRILVNSGFFERLGIYNETNKMQAANEVQRALRGVRRRATSQTSLSSSSSSTTSREIPPFKAYKREAFDRFWAALGDDQVLARIYTSKDLRERVRSAYDNSDPEEFYELWKKVANLFKFEGKPNVVKIGDLVKEIGEGGGRIVVIDLSETDVPQDILWSDSIRLIVIGEFLGKISREAKTRYKENNLLNCLVIIDEAHRLAPREKTENEDLERVKAILIDAIRTTRKYGLGWMFISQTLSSIDKRIIEQIRTYVFGFGLGWGVERQALLEIIGGQKEALSLYQMFRDPQSSLGEREYPFMTIGPISPLSFSGTPLFFNALEYPDEFLKINLGGVDENK
jgi:hypothetical protein